MILDFPDSFDPFTASDADIARLVRALWTDAVHARLTAEAAQMDAELDQMERDMPDTIPLTEADLNLYLSAEED